jgi:aspartyl-tRNA(Asn)/glutamyl-tRNA(Gln) amidotransferase subunit C
MKLTEKTVELLAVLSRLRVSPEESRAYVQDLESILGYVEKLAALKTDGVAETQHADEGTNVWRDDVVKDCDPDVRRRLLAAFPRRNGDLLEVQAVFEGRTE